MRRYSGKQAWRRRIIALAAAYAIALSSLVASFGAARAAAEAATNPIGILCHNALAGAPSPASDRGNSKTCIDCCCTGCLMPMAALLPPPPTAAPLAQTVSHRPAPIALTVPAVSRTGKSHRSRAPPA